MITCRSNSLVAALLLAAAVSLSACSSLGVASAPATVAVAASDNTELTTFNKLLAQAGLQDTLTGTGPLTVFAPTDEAFKAVPAATLDKLSKDPALLKDVLKYHMVPAAIKAADVTGTAPTTTLQGAKMNLAKAGDFLTVDEGLVTKADVVAGNGVLHIVDTVLMPPKK